MNRFCKILIPVGSLIVILVNFILINRSENKVLAVENTTTEVNLTPIADTYVDIRYQNSNFGSARISKVDNSPREESYLKFQRGDLNGIVTSAKLRVYVTNPSISGGSVAKMSNVNWSESTITYNNRPAIDGVVLSTLKQVNQGQWYEFDVTKAVTGNTILSFGMTSNNSDGVDYASREDIVRSPRLIITLLNIISSTPTTIVASPTPTPTPTAISNINSRRPYATTSPWNTPIGSNPVYDVYSAQRVARISGYFASDTKAYTFPVYQVTNATPLRSIALSGTFTSAVDNDSVVIRHSRVSVSVPVPAGAQPSAGSDGHLLVWNTDTGDEWGFWQFKVNTDGSLVATNGYHYNTNWDGVPPTGTFLSRGSGTPNLAGLIRPWEIAQGHIDHALAFAYPSPTSRFIYPAINSDGSSTNIYDMPEGTRFQLDPTLTDADFTAWGLSQAGKVIARAMQEYGLIITDRSGTPQLFPEDSHTANWNGVVANGTVSKIPYSRLKVLAP